jgi:hypothetical protein
MDIFLEQINWMLLITSNECFKWDSQYLEERYNYELLLLILAFVGEFQNQLEPISGKKFLVEIKFMFDSYCCVRNV